MYFFQCNDNDKLNDIAILCCEFTAQCPSLSSEWLVIHFYHFFVNYISCLFTFKKVPIHLPIFFRLAALATLCISGQQAYHDLLSQIDVSNHSNYNRLAIFVSILIARQCFQLEHL